IIPPGAQPRRVVSEQQDGAGLRYRTLEGRTRSGGRPGQQGVRMSQDANAADHWQFSLAVYTRDGVAEHCLALQSRLGLDVNVLLLMLWAAGQWGDAPTAAQITDADSRINAWRHE